MVNEQFKLEAVDLSKGELKWHPDIIEGEEYIVVRKGKRQLGKFYNWTYGLYFDTGGGGYVDRFNYDRREITEIYRIIK